jgi:hypothetical protein
VKHLRLSDTYKDAAVGVIEERLAQAGIRLATSCDGCNFRSVYRFIDV